MDELSIHLFRNLVESMKGSAELSSGTVTEGFPLVTITIPPLTDTCVQIAHKAVS